MLCLPLLQDRMELSVSVHTKAAGIWPMITSTALWTQVPGAANPSSPASMGTVSLRTGNVITMMTVVMAATSWRLSVVSCTQSFR